MRNDANFTLRALLLIATFDAGNGTSLLEPSHEALLSTIEKIAMEFIPLDEFWDVVKAELKREHKSVRARRERKNAHKKKIAKQATKGNSKISSTVTKSPMITGNLVSIDVNVVEIEGAS